MIAFRKRSFEICWTNQNTAKCSACNPHTILFSEGLHATPIKDPFQGSLYAYPCGLCTSLLQALFHNGFRATPCQWGLHATPMQDPFKMCLHKTPLQAPLKVAMKRCCLWEKRIWILLDQAECNKMHCTNQERSPNLFFFQGLTDHIGDCRQSPIYPG